MTNEAVFAELLGVSRPNPGQAPASEIVKWVKEGLPIQALDRIAAAIAPHDRDFRFGVVKKTTLSRRRSEPSGYARLSEMEGAKVVRLARVWTLACEVWKTDEAARDFLHRAHPLLEGRHPIDVVMESEFGGPRVEAVLGRLQYGSAA